VIIELDPVDHITTDAVGPAGQRTFYLQGRRGEQLVTLLVEKQQVQLLSASVVEILAQIGKETGQGPPEEQMVLDEPIIPQWRAGRLSIGYHDERDLLMLEVEELIPDEEEGEEATGEGKEPGLEPDASAAPGTVAEPQRVRFWATREQMLSLARHGANVCAAGRPLCPYCHNPLDPEGHQCPAMNGHRSPTEA
jgi:uncharacterized repeat protein (TIGR03847 family)